MTQQRQLFFKETTEKRTPYFSTSTVKDVNNMSKLEAEQSDPLKFDSDYLKFPFVLTA